MGTYTGTIGTAKTNNNLYAGNYISTGITIPNNEQPSTINITNLSNYVSSSDPGTYWKNNLGSAQNYTIYLSNSNGSIKYAIGTISLSANGSNITQNSFSASCPDLHGQAIYFSGSGASSTNFQLRNGKTAAGISITTAYYYTACGAPTSVTLSRNGNGKLKVSWSGGTSGITNPIASYYVYLSTSSGGAAASGLTATVNSTSGSGEYTFTVNNQTTYYAAVRTQGSAGSSYYSGYKWSSGLAATYYTACGAPTSVTLARDGNGKLKVTWSGATAGTNNAISNYYVYLSTSSGGGVAGSFSATTTATSYTFTVNNTTTYYAAVRTQGAAGSSYYSGYKWSSGLAATYYTACGAPTSVTLARDGNGKLKVTWSGASAGTNNSISNYGVVLSTSSGGSAAFSQNASSSPYTFTVNNQTAYYAGVRTQGSAGSSYYSGYKWSSSSLAATYSTACGAPTSVTLTQDGNGKLKVTWSGASAGTNNSISSYYVYLSTSSGGSAASGLTATVTTTSTSSTYTFTVNNTTTYYAAVRTQGSAGSSFYSAYKWSSGKAAYYYTNPSTPTNVTLVQDGNGKLKASWTASSGGTNNAVAGYHVILTTSASSTTAAFSADPTATSYTFTVNNTTTYYARVYAKGTQSGYNSGWGTSGAKAAYYYTNPSTPANVTLVQDGNGKLKASWSASSGGTNNAVAGYHVILTTSASSTTAAFSADPTTTSYTFTVNNTTTYYARVYAKGTQSGYNSGWGTSGAKAAYYYTSPSVPANVTLVQNGNGKLTASWSASSNGTNNAVNGYYVILTTSASSTTAAFSANLTTTSYTFTVNNTTTYYARVYAKGTQSDYNSGWGTSGAQAAYYYTVCIAPASVTVTRSRGTITITWPNGDNGTNNNITSYGIIRNTSQSETNAVTVNSSASSGATNQPGTGTFYYGVRSQGSAGASYYSNYTWSNSITVPVKPTIQEGDIITEAQMDSLRAWINTNDITDISSNSKVLASHGNTYYNTLTTSTILDDQWYSSAADG